MFPCAHSLQNLWCLYDHQISFVITTCDPINNWSSQTLLGLSLSGLAGFVQMCSQYIILIFYQKQRDEWNPCYNQKLSCLVVHNLFWLELSTQVTLSMKLVLFHLIIPLSLPIFNIILYGILDQIEYAYHDLNQTEYTSAMSHSHICFKKLWTLFGNWCSLFVRLL